MRVSLLGCKHSQAIGAQVRCENCDIKKVDVPHPLKARTRTVGKAHLGSWFKLASMFFHEDAEFVPTDTC